MSLEDPKEEEIELRENPPPLGVELELAT